MYKLDIFCMPEQKEVVLNTLHETGVDKIGNYDHCWVISSVKGSHRSMRGSKPVFGGIGKVENYKCRSHSYRVCGQAVEENIRLGRTDCEYL